MKWLLFFLQLTSFAQCDTVIGEVHQLTDYPSSYNYLDNLGYCYELSPMADSATCYFSFTATNHTAVFSAAYSAVGCNVVNMTGSALIGLDSCQALQSGFVFTDMVIGQQYIWKLTLASSGPFCQGISTVCPYYIGFNFLPVKMVDFVASSMNEGVKLNWSTLSETNSYQFVIERAGESFFFREIGEVRSAGNSNSRIGYSFVDREALTGPNYYRLVEVDYNGARAGFEPIFINHVAPKVVSVMDLLGRSVDMTAKGLKVVTFDNGRSALSY